MYTVRKTTKGYFFNRGRDDSIAIPVGGRGGELEGRKCSLYNLRCSGVPPSLRGKNAQETVFYPSPCLLFFQSSVFYFILRVQCASYTFIYIYVGILLYYTRLPLLEIRSQPSAYPSTPRTNRKVYALRPLFKTYTYAFIYIYIYKCVQYNT